MSRREAGLQNLPNVDPTKDYEAVEEAFIEWLARPKSKRLPKTQKEFASLRGVSQNYLTSLKKKPETEAKVKRLRMEVVDDALPEIIRATVEAAKDTRYGHSDRKLLLEMAGYAKAGASHKDSAPDKSRDPRGMTDDEIEQKIQKLLQEEGATGTSSD